MLKGGESSAMKLSFIIPRLDLNSSDDKSFTLMIKHEIVTRAWMQR
jgi:hypothetical protein